VNFLQKNIIYFFCNWLFLIFSPISNFLFAENTAIIFFNILFLVAIQLQFFSEKRGSFVVDTSELLMVPSSDFFCFFKPHFSVTGTTPSNRSCSGGPSRNLMCVLKFIKNERLKAKKQFEK
jgi:hypothetical protein